MNAPHGARSQGGEETPDNWRFVQLPVDVERSHSATFVAATTRAMTLRISSAPFDGNREAELVGVLVALLHRYTEQQIIALDLFVVDGEEARCTTADIAVDGETTMAALIAATETALRLASSAQGVGHSNVAATVLLSPSAATEARRPETGLARYDAEFVFGRDGAGYYLAVGYNANLVGEVTASRWLESYATLLEESLGRPNAPVGEVPLLTPQQLEELLSVQESGVARYPEVPVHVSFERLAKQQPTAVAAVCEDRSITYGELDERSNQLAHYLVSRNVGPDVPVAVCVRPSFEILVAMLAIWKARGLYFPLDPTHPEAYIARMVDEAKPRIVLTTAELSALTSSFPQLKFDTDADVLRVLPKDSLASPPTLTDAAYLFYTSGTTGRAKGVVATHGNLGQYIHSAREKYGFSAKDVFSSVARYTFSISLFELLSPLSCGASLRILTRDEVLTPDRLCRALEQVTVMHVGPSLLASLFHFLRSTSSTPKSLPRMRHASSGGDIVPPSIQEEMKRVFPNAELFVIYGCTEVSCMGTTFPIRRDSKVNRTFVGKAFPNVTVRVLDAKKNLVPFGVVGEIHFAGSGVVRGYLDRPELTAEKFTELEGRRFYQTGDMGRLHSNGDVEILGRRDFQVQLRGIRIELAGIERTVQELGLAAQCAVVARTVKEGDVRLIAFIVRPREVQIATFRRTLAEHLPDYMLPHHVAVLDAMPLTANGKLDRNRLKELPWETQLQTAKSTPPANEQERKIVEVFAHVLGVNAMGVEDNFFDLGGDSLLAVVALQALGDSIGMRIPPHVLFQSGTARGLATDIAGGVPSASRPMLLNRVGEGPAVYAISGAPYTYRRLGELLDGHCTLYGVLAQSELGAFDGSDDNRSIETQARDYVAVIRRQQRSGPYWLLGYSFAGIVAYETAQQLRDAGEEVRFLALIDPHLPEWDFGWRYRVSQFRRMLSAPRKDVLAFLARRIRARLDPFTDEAAAKYYQFVERHDNDELNALEMRRYASTTRASSRYLPHIRPYPWNVSLIVSAERLRDDPLKSPTCGWGPYIASLDVSSVDGPHLRMMFDEPHVSGIAEILAEAVKKARVPDTAH